MDQWYYLCIELTVCPDDVWQIDLSWIITMWLAHKAFIIRDNEWYFVTEFVRSNFKNSTVNK